MNEIQGHLIKLLKEIDQICTQNGMPYLLGGRTAKDACQSHHFLGDYVYATVMMRGQDFHKFRKLVGKMEGRTVESVRENPDFPDGMAMRYVDETTTFLYGHTAHNYRCKGIYVTIQYCRRIPRNKYKARMANAIDSALTYAQVEDASGMGKKKKLVFNCLHLGIKLFGKRYVLKRLLSWQDKLTRTGGKKLAYVRPMKKNIRLPAAMFTEVQRVELEGEAFFVPVKYDAYLEQVFGKNWAIDERAENIASPHLLVSSTEISYKQIDNDESLYKNRRQINDLINKRKALAAKIKTLRDKIEGYWDILFLTKERYQLYRQYMPVVHILQEHLAVRDYQWLNLAMKDYMDTLGLYLSKNLPMTTCQELDTVALELMAYSCKLGQAQKFRRLCSSRALKPINVKLDENAADAALAQLPPVIRCTAENEIPVFLRTGAGLRAVVRLDGGQAKAVLIRCDDEIVPAYDAAANNAQLAVENGQGGYTPLADNALFENETVLPLVQSVFGQELQLAWVDKNGQLYVCARFGEAGRYEAMELAEYLSFGQKFDVPVRYLDRKTNTLRELFCLSADGQPSPVMTMGVGGYLWVTPNAAQMLYYKNEDNENVALRCSDFADEAAYRVKQVLYGTGAPAVCCKLVQQDAFGRVTEIASLYDNGCILPTVRRNADGTLAQLESQEQTYATLCLRQSDGTSIPLAALDAQGNALTAIAPGHHLPVQILIGGHKNERSDAV